MNRTGLGSTAGAPSSLEEGPAPWDGGGGAWVRGFAQLPQGCSESQFSHLRGRDNQPSFGKWQVRPGRGLTPVGKGQAQSAPLSKQGSWCVGLWNCFPPFSTLSPLWFPWLVLASLTLQMRKLRLRENSQKRAVWVGAGTVHP